MPRLLDNRLIGFDIGDVKNKTYSGAQPGWVLKVASDGASMELGQPSASSNATQALVARDSERSRDGLSFQQFLCKTWVDITPSTGALFQVVNGVTYGRGRFVAVGFTSANEPVIKYTSITAPSPSMEPWTDVPTMPFPAGTRVWGVKFFDDKFIAYGQNGYMATSVDGVNWTLLTQLSPAAHIYSVAYGAGVGWLAVGQLNTNNTTGAGAAFFSVDATTWTQILPNPLGTGKIRDNTGAVIDGPIPMYGVVYGKDKFVVVGGEVYNPTLFPHEVNHIAYSTTGQSGSWIVTPSQKPRSSHYVAEYGNGRYVIGTNDGPDNGGAQTGTTLLFSNDGISWSASFMLPQLAAQGNLQGLVYGNGVFVATNSSVYVSVDSLTYYNAQTPAGWPGTNPSPGSPPSGSPGVYGNGLFVFGSRGGKIMRSAFGIEVFGGGAGGGGGGGGGYPVFPAIGSYSWAIPYDATNFPSPGYTLINPGGTTSGTVLIRYTGDPFSASPTSSTLPGTWSNVGDRAYSFVSSNPSGLQLPPIFQAGLFQRIS